MYDAPFSISVPTAIRFGDGVSAQVCDVLPEGATTVAMLRGAGGVAAAPVSARLHENGLVMHEIACGGEPSVASINAAVNALQDRQIDAVVACGGGSVIDCAKAVTFCLAHGVTLGDDFSAIPASLLAAPSPLPCIAVPTTAGTGAEVTANAVLEVPSQQAKISLRGRALVPHSALVDPLLLPTAPAATSLASGLDAVVQTLEAYTSCAATPFSDALTAPNMTQGLSALRRVIETGEPEAWRALAWVSLTSGMALANSGLGAAHGLASVLGARFDAPHGALCGRLLVPVLRQNRLRSEAGSEARRRLDTCAEAVARVFPPQPGEDALAGLEAWQEVHGLARLADFGVMPEQIGGLAVQGSAASSSRKNAVPLPEEDYAAILQSAL